MAEAVFNFWDWTLRGWRTIIANILLALPYVWDLFISLLEAFVLEANSFKISTLIPKEYINYYTIAMVVVNILIRLDTKTPVGKKL